MFDVGFSELLIIAIVALVVLGPERLPKAARFAGLWVRRARAQWQSVKSEFERDLAADEMRRSMQDARDAMRGIDDSVRAHDADLRREFDAMRGQMRGVAPGEAGEATPPTDAPVDDGASATPVDADGDPAMDGAWPHESAPRDVAHDAAVRGGATPDGDDDAPASPLAGRDVR